MRPTIHWHDRVRSFLSGHPASTYATRRLAREDIHALEADRARAVSRLTEDLELLDRYVNPLERYMDGDRLVAPLGTILDRRSGKNLPLVWTELDLREFRRMARVICDVNPFAVGFLGLLTDFHLRQGFGWQAREMENGKWRMENGDTDTSPVVHKAQSVLDEWRNHQLWGLKSREAFRRWRRDGEVFLRFFRGGEGSRGLPVIRFVEPEQVGPPPGDDAEGEWSFGVRTDPEDIEDVISYFVRDPLGTGSEGDEVPADRIIHLKANVDSSIKRGLPDFLPVQDDLERVRRILRNMGEVAAVQTAIAWVSQYATATPEQVGTLIRAGSDYTRPKLGSPSGKLIDVVRYEPGTVLHMDDNRQFVPGPVGTGTPGFIQVEQAILRGCGARWRMPEYFSGDASNNNLASSITAGSPFVVAVEGTQLEWAVFERAVAMKVLELCVESGRLRPEDIADINVKAIPPAVALANREEEERLRQMRHQAGVLSVTTWQQQVGLDPKHESANFAAEAKRKAALQALAGVASTVDEAEPPCICEDRVTEAEHAGSHGFTGEFKDSLGRRRCYKDGKEIPCDKPGDTGASAGEPGKDEPKTSNDSSIRIKSKRLSLTSEEVIKQMTELKVIPSDAYVNKLGLKGYTSVEAFKKQVVDCLEAMQKAKGTYDFDTDQQLYNYLAFMTWRTIFARQYSNLDSTFAPNNNTVVAIGDGTNWVNGRQKVRLPNGEERDVATIAPKAGVTGAEAIRSLFGPDGAKLKADCGTAQVLIIRRAMLETLGDRGYNLLLDTPISAWHIDNAKSYLGRIEAYETNEKKKALLRAQYPLVPGQAGAFSNPGAGDNDSYRYENIIYLGTKRNASGQEERVFYANPQGIVTEAELIKDLEQRQKAFWAAVGSHTKPHDKITFDMMYVSPSRLMFDVLERP